MKKVVILLAFIMVGTLAFAQVDLGEHSFVSGRWTVSGDRLYQNDETARLAKVNIKTPQEGLMIYEFDARYEGGTEDGHGGFGLHFFVDESFDRISWGAGSSFLLWLNYDENPINKEIPAGLSAQLYRSRSNSVMDLIESIDLNHYAEFLTDEYLSNPVTFKIIVNGNNGEIWVYDPTEDDDTYYILDLDTNFLPLSGDWVVLRTNGIKLSFSFF